MSTDYVDGAVAADEVKGFFEDLAALAASALSAPQRPVVCGITIETRNAQTTVASSSPRASMLDEIQYEVDRGPCLHAVRTGETVHIPDLESADAWPMWRERALAAGVGSSLSVSVPTTASMNGGAGFNFYADHPDSFDEQSLERAMSFAQRAVSGVALGLRLVEAGRLTDNLRAALGSRSVIDQALGVIMAADRCSADVAFQALRRASNNRNLKLQVVAAEIVERISGEKALAAPHFT